MGWDIDNDFHKNITCSKTTQMRETFPLYSKDFSTRGASRNFKSHISIKGMHTDFCTKGGLCDA